MADRLSTKNFHDPDVVADHTTVTGTDVELEDGCVKRGLNITSIDNLDVELTEEYRLRVITLLNSMNESLIRINKILEAIASE